MTSDQFCLKWNNYQSNIVVALGNLKLEEEFVDVTLACEGRSIKAHRVVLSACSGYFKHVFKVRGRGGGVVEEQWSSGGMLKVRSGGGGGGGGCGEKEVVVVVERMSWCW